MPLKKGSHVHFIGIGGVGLSAIARVMREEGYKVTGCDLQASPLSDQLKKNDVKISIGHDTKHVSGEDKPDAVVISSAVPDDNPEVQAAREAKIAVYKRAHILSELMKEHQGIAVAGTHGKTTTAAMIAYVLDQVDLKPTYIVGGVLQNTGTNAQAGSGKPFVVEADEYDRMFMGLKPDIAVVTNIEHDHPDDYKSLAEVVAAFNDFVALLPDDGLLIACYDDPQARLLAERRRKADKPVLTYGLSQGADLRAVEIIPSPEGGYNFIVKKGLALQGMVRIQLLGKHNVRNALAVLAVAEHLKVQFEVVAAMFAEFRGVERRFEHKGRVSGITLIDDYAHHPTEVKATLEAARAGFGSRPLWVVFQPHTFSRTRALLDDFAKAFEEAEHVVVTDIFGARETNDARVSSAQLVKAMKHPDARHIGKLSDVVTHLATSVEAGDVIITMSAGDAGEIHDDLLKTLDIRFASRETKKSKSKIFELHKQFLEELDRREREGKVSSEDSKTWRKLLDEATLSSALLERLLVRLREGNAADDEETVAKS